MFRSFTREMWQVFFLFQVGEKACKNGIIRFSKKLPTGAMCSDMILEPGIVSSKRLRFVGFLVHSIIIKKQSPNDKVQDI